MCPTPIETRRQHAGVEREDHACILSKTHIINLYQLMGLRGDNILTPKADERRRHVSLRLLHRRELRGAHPPSQQMWLM